MGLTVYVIPLKCGHAKLCRSKPPPKPGDEVWCAFCADYTQAHGPEWWVSCAVCRYKRRVGLDEKWAESRARKHLMSRGIHHRVSIWRDDKPEQTRRVVMPDTPLPLPGQYPF